MRGCGTRGQMQTDERPRAACCDGWTEVDRQSEGRYTFGGPENPEVLSV